MWERGCQGGEADACARIGEKYESGPTQNPILASIYFQRGCNQLHADSCAGLGRVEISRQGGNNDTAKRAFDNACMRGSDLGCAASKILFKGTHPVFAKPNVTNAWRSACNAGQARACANLGAVNVASGNKIGEMDIQRACTMQDKFACALQKAIKP
jgi:TPR repeat protein